jgi:hypothetical protein
MADREGDAKSIFYQLIALEPEERPAFLAGACGDDNELLREVEALLRFHDDSGTFPQSPVAAGGAGILETNETGSEVDLGFLQPSDKPDRLGMLDHYEIIELIGRGGMGVVLRGLDTKLDRVVAIKVLAPELAANATARAVSARGQGGRSRQPRSHRQHLRRR